MANGLVIEYDAPDGSYREHERASRAWVAANLALVKAYDHAGIAQQGRLYEPPVYVVPAETLDPEQARALGVRGSEDLFGGVAPHAFVATKTIAHPLVDREAHAPEGWSHGLAGDLAASVLPGFAAFTAGDARRAARAALARWPVRAKLSRHRGGSGQAVIGSVRELEKLLEAESDADLLRYGMVLEEQLEEMSTYSVGQVTVGAVQASYCGTQRSVANSRGDLVYGGSDLRLVRGGFDRLEALSLCDAEREAVVYARRFDAATRKAFPGLFHSRSNYDVLRGRAADGKERCGVLEQSWRMGGASAAEAAALLAFKDNERLETARAATFEVYGECEPPPHARVIFRGVDAHAGRLTKYCTLDLE